MTDCPACGGLHRVAMLPEVRALLDSHHGMDAQKDARIRELTETAANREAYWHGVEDGLAARLGEQTKRAVTAEYDLDAMTNDRNRIVGELDNVRAVLAEIARDYRERAEQSDPEIVNVRQLDEFAEKIEPYAKKG